MGGQTEPNQCTIRRMDRRTAPLGLLGRHLYRFGRHQAPAAC